MKVVRYGLGLLSVVLLALNACNSSSSSNSITFPDVSDIVAAAAPTSFAGGARRQSRDSCASYAAPANIFSCISQYVLSDSQPAGAVGQWFLYWVNNLDGRLAELVTRFSSSAPACQSATPTDLTFVIDSSTSDTISGTTSLSIPVSFSCYDSYTGPDGVTEGGGVAWGSKDGYTYLMDRSTGNSGLAGVERIISIAKVNSAGDEAEIWVLMNGTSANTPSIMRIKANKTTKAFAYENRAGHTNNYFQYLFIQSDGTAKMYTAGSNSSGASLSAALGTSSCVKPDSFTTLATGCTTDNLDRFPTSAFVGSDVSIGAVASASTLYTAINAITTDPLTGVGTVD